MPSRYLTGLRVGLLAVLLAAAAGAWPVHGNAAFQDAPVTVSGVISIAGQGGESSDRSDVVVWLAPPGGALRDGRSAAPARPRFKIVQQGKRFEPHLLVVPAGSLIDFPNLDPFFHNVFSLFDGKRFDLGLYEAGTSRSVGFPTPGVCYVFCNIHPDMSALVVVVDSSYYATSNRTGAVSIPNVPPGRYTLKVWHDRFKPENPSEYPKDVVISAAAPSVGSIRLVETARALGPHKNKFGHDYAPPGSTSPIYR